MTVTRIQSVDALIKNNLATHQDKTSLQQVAQHFSIGITDHIAQHIDPSDPNDPLKKQFVPDQQELAIQPHEKIDPIGDGAHTQVKGIIHRYPDRCLLVPVRVCAVYCRFCFRKEHIGPHSPTLTPEELDQALHYIETHPDIWEVILTGGDPLIMKPVSLQKITDRLGRIDSLGVIRFHTRIPVVDPDKITPELIDAFKANHKTTYLVLHINHAKELTPKARSAIAALINAGIVVLSQTVLLKGINNNIDVLGELMKELVLNRVKPYYLHHPDLAKGTQHFRLSIAEGQQLAAQLRARFSGLCQPQYVLDIPGGYGKVPIHQPYINDHNKGYYSLTDHAGNRHEYTD